METWKHEISGTSQLSFLNMRTTFPPHGDLACTYSFFCSPLSKTLEKPSKLFTTHLSAVLLIHQLVFIRSYSFILQEAY